MQSMLRAKNNVSGVGAACLRSVAALLCSVAMPALVQADSFSLVKAAVFEGVSVNDAFGSSVASVGDVNGDGFNDLLVGAYYDDTVTIGSNGLNSNTGSAYLYLGSAKGFPATISPSSASAVFTGGLIQRGNFGYTVAAAGDMNGDGLKDFAVSSTGLSGTVFIFLGRSSGFSGQIDAMTASARINGVSGLGNSLAAGDVDGDGKTDLVIGEEKMNKVYIYRGSSSLPVFTDLNGTLPSHVTAITGLGGSRFGLSVASGGDINKDGFDDILVGAPRANAQAGSAYVILGRSSFGASTVVASAAATKILSGVSAGDHFGSSVAILGDTDVDGFPEVAFGAQSLSDSSVSFGGAVYVAAGASGATPFGATQSEAISALNTVTIVGDADADNLGQSVVSAGDINGDGAADYLVGAHSADGTDVNSGVVALINGSRNTIATRSSLSRLAKATFSGDLEDDSAGNSVAGPFDSDKDGKLEYLVGAPGYNTVGRAYIVEVVTSSEASSGSGSVLTEETTPSVPTRLSVRRKLNSNKRAFWNVSFRESTTGAVRYEVDIRRFYSLANKLTAQGDWKTYTVRAASGREVLTSSSTLRSLGVNFTRLHKKTTYLARVRACNATKCSAYSSTKRFEVK